jgi:prepilin-type N-terminal cleavage/methylation domain-containing protein
MRPSGASNRTPESGFTLIELLVVLAIIAILAAIAIETTLYAFDVAKLGNTVGAMRGVCTVVMDYESASSTIPGGGLQPVSAVEPILRSVGAPVPIHDGWGNDLFYEPVVVGGQLSFRVYSYGKDGTPDGSVPGVWVDFFSDVVAEGGSFLQTKW